ncbi:carboxylesterase/lipase family protein [Oleiagrimonas sp.]|jgi:para-nitrobenzyl esterase|uniref:carboxylesterase/lipase family protein n=1 Tax=Oleiagrimonas sp. TaxID=2010330 RepID=UPI002625F0FA|nr:carboxylesterase/lipase family protein [Oleiagrimonas sp.]MDA3913726.1 carboxylesterase family protein [Oleiagrimonas sp.]
MKKILLILIVSFAFGLLEAPACAYAKNSNSDIKLIVRTEYGSVEGKLKDNTREFLGIPYARPPLGRLRWRPPVAPIKWNNILLATKYAGGCAQGANGIFSDATTNENCLYLNIFTPYKLKHKKKLAVMVWIYGGGLAHGSSDGYNPSMLVRNGNVIVVTLNYRMNIFGFLALPGLDKEGHRFGNYGLMDQQFALKWVKRNISSFGGDPNNVTIFGESAGGLSVLANIISPTAKGLFEGAIEESGSYTSLTTPESLDKAEINGKKFAKKVGCGFKSNDKTISCLRRLPVRKIQALGGKYSNGRPNLIIDGTVLTRTQKEAFETGDFNKVPIIIGTNKDEVTNFIGHAEYVSGSQVTKAQFVSRIRKTYGKYAVGIFSRYKISKFKRPDLALAAVGTDSIFVCPGLEKANLISKFVPTYYYEFADETAPVYLHMAPIPYGAYHSSELQYLFFEFHGSRGRIHMLDAKQEDLSRVMISYWTNFAKNHGNPNSGYQPYWPLFIHNKFMSLNSSRPGSKTLLLLKNEHHCGFWDSLKH